MKEMLYIIIGIVAIFLVVLIILNVKSGKKSKKPTVVDKKKEEVEILKLDIEKEKLQAELTEMKEPKVKFCPYCKTKNDAKATRCSKCGVGFGQDY